MIKDHLLWTVNRAINVYLKRFTRFPAFFQVGGHVFLARWLQRSMKVKDTDHKSVALKIGLILLCSGEITTAKEKQITVEEDNITQVFKAVGVNDRQSKTLLPEVHCVRTIVSDTWFEKHPHSTPFQAEPSEQLLGTLNPPSLPMHDPDLSEVEKVMEQLEINSSTAKDLLPLLNYYWGYSNYVSQQEKAIDAILKGSNVFVSMPTGGGKSLIYTLPALASPGMTIVIEPTLSLIQDQLQRMQRKSINAAAVCGEMPDNVRESVYRSLRQEQCPIKLLFVTPEALLNDKVLQNCLASVYLEKRIQRFAFDEAHCISSWGNEFRPAYIGLSVLHQLFSGVPMIFLSATATEAVRSDVMQQLGVQDWVSVETTYNRTNLFFKV